MYHTLDLTLRCPLLPYVYSYKHRDPDWVKPVICNYWHSGTLTISSAFSGRVPGCQKLKMTVNLVWHRMLYSCTHMATVGVKGLTAGQTQLCVTHLPSPLPSSTSYLVPCSLTIKIITRTTSQCSGQATYQHHRCKNVFCFFFIKIQKTCFCFLFFFCFCAFLMPCFCCCR